MKLNKNKKGQAGFVITAELLLITVVLVLGLVTGWAKLRDQTLAELSDTGSAIGSIDQGFEIVGTDWASGGGAVAATAGFGFQDVRDLGGESAGAIGGDSILIVYDAAAVLSTAVNDAGENEDVQ